jgi:hypothetical protein
MAQINIFINKEVADKEEAQAFVDTIKGLVEPEMKSVTNLKSVVVDGNQQDIPAININATYSEQI